MRGTVGRILTILFGQCCRKHEHDEKCPNLFDYGHKELSQDAMICWLLAWANECYKELNPHLHECGQKFARALFDKHEHPGPDQICTVKLGMQVSSIDVLAWVNDKYALLIEDKTDSTAEGNQLERYHKKVLDGQFELWGTPVKPCASKLFPILLKTGNMSLADKCGIEKLELDPPYRVFERKDFLNILKDCDRNLSEILGDFQARLEALETRFNSWRETPVETWCWDGWQGFYRYLEETYSGDMDWDYIPIGDFLGLWWKFTDAGEEELYLQAEQCKLCFKIIVEERERRKDRRSYWSQQVLRAAVFKEMAARKPPRFGTGKHMTVAILEGDWRQTDGRGLLDLEATKGVLRNAEQVLDQACKPVE